MLTTPWIHRLLVALLLLVLNTALATTVTLSANSRLGENLQDARGLRVACGASDELQLDSCGSCGLMTAGCSVAPSTVSRQTMATGSEWYEYYAGKYGAQNVDWVSGSGRTITWPSELPMPANSQMFRVPSPPRSSTFVSELESVAGPRPPVGIGHHNQPLGLNGVDNGATNGSWQFNPAHQNGHNPINSAVNRLPYGTEIRIKPGG